jgi:hypothetical protein
MMFAYNCELDLYRTYAGRRPALARECASAARRIASEMGRWELAVAAGVLEWEAR